MDNNEMQFEQSTEMIEVNGNSYKAVTITQLPTGNYSTNDIGTFVEYYALNNLTYTIFNKIKFAFNRGLEAQRVIDIISYRFGVIYFEIAKYFKLEGPDVLDIIFTIKDANNKTLESEEYSNFLVRITNGVSAVDASDLFEGMSTAKISNETSEKLMTVGLSANLSKYIIDTYEGVKESGEFPKNISSFYFSWISHDNPLKRTLKPYTIDATYIVEHLDEIIAYSKDNNTDGGLTSSIEGKTFWEEMAIKAVAIASYNADRELKSAEHRDILGEMDSLLSKCELDPRIATIIKNTFKSCIANKHRIVFIKDFESLLGNNEEYIEHWNKIKKACSKLFLTSFYCYD
jgi:hypothetical protein